MEVTYAWHSFVSASEIPPEKILVEEKKLDKRLEIYAGVFFSSKKKILIKMLAINTFIGERWSKTFGVGAFRVRWYTRWWFDISRIPTFFDEITLQVIHVSFFSIVIYLEIKISKGSR